MCKRVSEAFVMVLALINPATADPIRRCLCSPFSFKYSARVAEASSEEEEVEEEEQQ